MKKTALLLISSLFLFNYYGKTQSPGGISTNHLKLWLKANSIAAANGAVLGTWNDNSPKVYNATQAYTTVPDSAPNYEDNTVNNVNFNPSVLFNGTKSFMHLNGSNNAADPAFEPNHDDKYTNYTVIQPDPSYALGTAANPGKIWFSGTGGGPDLFTSMDVRTTGVINDSWNQDDNLSPGANYQSYPILITLTYDTATDTRTIYTYGASVSTNIFGFQATNTGNINYGIGCQLSANPHLEFYNGTTSEIVSYTKANHAGTNSKTKIESYLAIKYGLTLSGENYLSSNGTVVWNTASGAADYNKNIIGLARDDASGLMQKESTSTGGMPNFTPDLLTIFIGAKTTDNATNTGTFTAGDKSFFMAGCDTTSVCGPQSAPHDDVPPGICCRIGKQWLTQVTNFTNTDVTLEFNLPSCASHNLSAANLRLLVDDDGNFINAVALNIVAGAGPALTSITVAGSVVDVKLPASYFTSNAGYTDTKVHPYFTLGSVINTMPLPIELLYFTANLQDDKTVLCKWETRSETNNATFTVEKSADGINFESFATLPGAGTSSQTHYYSATDENPYMGLSYYRLKQTDYDGHYTYSILAPITINPTDEISIGNAKLGNGNSFMQIISKDAGIAKIEITDVTGRILYVKDQNLVSGFNNVIIPQSFSTGIYVVKAISASGNSAQKKVLGF